MFARRLRSLMCFMITLGLLTIDISIVRLRIWNRVTSNTVNIRFLYDISLQFRCTSR